MDSLPDATLRATVAFLEGVDGALLSCTSRSFGVLVDESFWRTKCEELALDLPITVPAKAGFPTAMACAALETITWETVSANLAPTEGCPILAVDNGHVFVFGGWGGDPGIRAADVAELESTGRLEFTRIAECPIPTYNGAASDIGDGELVYTCGFGAGGYRLEVR